MAGHPQNSPRGLFQKKNVTIGTVTLEESSSLLAINKGLTVTGDVGATTVTASGAISGSTLTATAASVTIGSLAITANSTCFKLTTRTALPNTRQLGGVCFVSNSTIKALAFHSTGTTWVYVDGTT